MVFAHDTEAALRAAVALVNSAGEAGAIETIEDLSRFHHEHAYTGRHDRDAAEFAEVLAIRPLLRDLLTAGRDAAAKLINQVFAESTVTPQLVRHGGLDWHVHAIGDDESWSRRIVIETAMAMIDVIRADEMSRLGVCANDDCEGVVLDLSRNRSRRFCSVACGNRAAVAAYRARQLR